MNIKGLPPRAVAVPPAESAALMARLASCARLIEERRLAKEREDAEYAAKVKAAADEAWRRLCATPSPPDNVTDLERYR